MDVHADDFGEVASQFAETTGLFRIPIEDGYIRSGVDGEMQPTLEYVGQREPEPGGLYSVLCSGGCPEVHCLILRSAEAWHFAFVEWEVEALKGEPDDSHH